MKYYSHYIDSPVYKLLTSNNIKTTEESIITFTDSLWNNCKYTGRSIGGCISFCQIGLTNYGSHVSAHVAISSSEAKYISIAVT